MFNWTMTPYTKSDWRRLEQVGPILVGINSDSTDSPPVCIQDRHHSMCKHCGMLRTTLHSVETKHRSIIVLERWLFGSHTYQWHTQQESCLIEDIKCSVCTNFVNTRLIHCCKKLHESSLPWLNTTLFASRDAWVHLPRWLCCTTPHVGNPNARVPKQASQHVHTLFCRPNWLWFT